MQRDETLVEEGTWAIADIGFLPECGAKRECGSELKRFEVEAAALMTAV